MIINCDICGRGRDSRFIGVYKRIFFCLDNPECVAKGKTWPRVKEAIEDFERSKPRINTNEHRSK